MSIFFTDPPYGLEKGNDDPAKEMDYNGVYRLAKGGTLTLLTLSMAVPNGIAFAGREAPVRGQFRPAKSRLDGLSGQG